MIIDNIYKKMGNKIQEGALKQGQDSWLWVHPDAKFLQTDYKIDNI